MLLADGIRVIPACSSASGSPAIPGSPRQGPR